MAWHWPSRPDEERTDTAQIEKVALGLLARREHSRFELTQKLSQRGFDAGALDEALDRLAGQGWQSDARYAEAYVRMRVERGYGLQAIRSELAQRGVARTLIDAALTEADIDWHACARRQIRRHYPGPTDGRDDRLRRYRHLLSRGFSPEQARQASAWWDDAAG